MHVVRCLSLVLAIRGFASMRFHNGKQVYTDLELQKMLESKEFFEDLIVVQNDDMEIDQEHSEDLNYSQEGIPEGTLQNEQLISTDNQLLSNIICNTEILPSTSNENNCDLVLHEVVYNLTDTNVAEDNTLGCESSVITAGNSLINNCIPALEENKITPAFAENNCDLVLHEVVYTLTDINVVEDNTLGCESSDTTAGNSLINNCIPALEENTVTPAFASKKLNKTNNTACIDDNQKENYSEEEYVPESDGDSNASKSIESGDNNAINDEVNLVEVEESPSKGSLKSKNQRLREKGLAYKGVKRNKDTGKYLYETDRQERKLQPTCNSPMCRKAKNRFCQNFGEADRAQLFNKFWKMSWDMRKIYVSSTVLSKNTARPYGNDSRRLFTLQYYLKKNDTLLRVCKKMYLNTLNINEWMVKHWVDISLKEGFSDSKDVTVPLRKRISDEKRQNIIFMQQFLNNLPKLESHYCRASTKKLYLEPLFQTKADVYRTYQEYCTQNNMTALSSSYFKKEMTTLNIAIHQPKKDQCDTCIGHKTKNISDEIFEEHIRRKKEAREEKQNDKDIALTQEDTVVFTMDVEAVKLSPILQASAIYFKTKLCVHNFTMFNLKSKDVCCYLWYEAEGGLEASVFCTIITKALAAYLERHPNTKSCILYSDGCAYQNRNSTLSNALYHFACQNNVVIMQKYLEKGHSQMEVDSAHSLIERKLKNKDIKLPSDYVDICKKARPKQPYNVEFLTHDYFLNFSNIRYYESIRPGHKKNDPHVTHLTCLKYTPNKGIEYKLHYTDEWQILPQRLRNIGNVEIPRLYQSRLKIKHEKYQHLQALKMVLPADVHDFYDNLPH